MVVFNLFPIGALQFYDALSNGYWHARSPEFERQPVVHFLEWVRLPGDAVFIVVGILPLIYLALKMVKYRHGPGEFRPGMQAPRTPRMPGIPSDTDASIEPT